MKSKKSDTLWSERYDWSAPPGSYVDARGVFPTFVDGQIAVSLEGYRRDISRDEAWHIARKHLGLTNNNNS